MCGHMKCPHCGHEINVGSLLGSVKSAAKTAAARANASKPRGPRKKRPADANALAFSVVADAEKLTQRRAKIPRTQAAL